MSSVGSVWRCDLPQAWALSPEEMTYSTLRQIETCPRRWSLSSANFPSLWAGRGYPPKLTTHALVGIVVHSVVARVSDALTRAGCASVRDPKTIDVMRGLGGYTKLIRLATESRLQECERNPRAEASLERLSVDLLSRSAEIRAKAQGLLANVRLASAGSAASAQKRGPLVGPLRPGLYPERVLRSKPLRWKGKADLLCVDENGCEVVEFKSGEPHDEHSFQLSIYGLLWLHDADLNPAARPPIKLSLVYTDKVVDVPVPTNDEFVALRTELAQRTTTALSEASLDPPPARPSIENCGFCGVRQLCAEYWSATTFALPGDAADDGGWADLQVTIKKRHGPSSWDAVVDSSHQAQPGSAVLIRLSGQQELKIGAKFRFIDLWLTFDDTTSVLVATAGAQTEVFAMP